MAFRMFALDVVIEIDEVNGTRDGVAVDLAMSLVCCCCVLIRCHCGVAISEVQILQEYRTDQEEMKRKSRATHNGDAPSYLSNQLRISPHYSATRDTYLSNTYPSQQEIYMHDRQKQSPQTGKLPLVRKRHASECLSPNKHPGKRNRHEACLSQWQRKKWRSPGQAYARQRPANGREFERILGQLEKGKRCLRVLWVKGYHIRHLIQISRLPLRMFERGRKEDGSSSKRGKIGKKGRQKNRIRP